MGDGEMQEGSNWEAAMTAAHYGLDNLTAVVDRNRLQQGARTEDTKTLEPLARQVDQLRLGDRDVDGHDHAALLEALGPSTTGKPVAIIADTIKGKGVSFMEDRVEWHHKVPTRRAGRGRTRGAVRMTAVTRDRRRRRPSTAASTSPTSWPRWPARTTASSRCATTRSGSSNLVGFREEFPDRLINVGIAEQDLVGVGAGLANAGLIPFVCAAAPFLTGRATEQIKADVAYSQRHVVLCGQSPGMAYGELGPDPPLDRGPVLDAGDRRPAGRRAGRPAADPRRRPLGGRPTAAAPTCASRGSRCPRFSRPTTPSSPAAPSSCAERDDVTIIADRHDGLARPVGRRHRSPPRGSRPGCSTWRSSSRSTERAVIAAARETARHRHRRGGHRQRRSRRRRGLRRRPGAARAGCGSSASTARSRPPAARPSCSTTSG